MVEFEDSKLNLLVEKINESDYAKAITNFLKETKYHVALSLGYENKSLSSFYFGTSLLSANIIPPPSILNIQCKPNEKIKMLLDDDPTFIVIKKNKNFIENMLGIKLEITLMDNDYLRKKLIDNSKLLQSKFDIISFDMPWTGEIHKNQYFLPLNSIINGSNFIDGLKHFFCTFCSFFFDNNIIFNH